MKLWVGLGNPGPSYARNRHNVGFMALDRIASDHGFSAWKTSAASARATGLIGGQKIILLKPLSYMNKSGLPVTETARFYKIAASEITVFHDEIDLAEGRVRVKQSGGHGGHNGLRDIDRHMGTDYWRVRIGVGRPDNKADVHKWVLQDFPSQSYSDWLDRLLKGLSDEADRLAASDHSGYASRLAYVAPAPKPPQTDKDTE